ncbi:MAG: hypothetical protein ACREMG_01225, partial [Gemmatimonadales bacterium]
MDCPRCGQTAVTEPACTRCGVIYAKLRPSRPRPAAVDPAPTDETEARGRGILRWLLEAAAVGLALGAAFWLFRNPPAPPRRPDRPPTPPAPSLPGPLLPPVRITV